MALQPDAQVRGITISPFLSSLLLSPISLYISYVEDPCTGCGWFLSSFHILVSHAMHVCIALAGCASATLLIFLGSCFFFEVSDFS